MPRFTVTIETGVDRVSLERWWRDLESRSDASFFLSWTWIGTWLELAPVNPAVLMAREGERVVALALLVPGMAHRHGWLTARSLHLHATGDETWDVIAIELNGVLVDRSVAAEATLAAMTHLFSAGGEWEELHCPGVAPTFANGLPGVETETRVDSGSAEVDLAAIRASGRPYLEHLSGNTRHQVRRAKRLYEERGPLRLTVAEDTEQALRDLDRLRVLHQAYWTRKGKPGAFARPFFTQFHRRLIERHHTPGLLEVVRVSAGSVELGYLYNFIWRGRVYAYQSGFAYEVDPKLKPGLVSHTLCVERHLGLGSVAYDFLGGDARYKTSLGQPGQRHAYLILQRPSWKFAIERGLKRAKRLLLWRD